MKLGQKLIEVRELDVFKAEAWTAKLTELLEIETVGLDRLV